MSLHSLDFFVPKKKELNKNFNEIFNNFEKSTIANIYINIIKLKKIFPEININEKKIIINEIHQKIEKFIQNKKIVSNLKSFLIDCYKLKITPNLNETIISSENNHLAKSEKIYQIPEQVFQDFSIIKNINDNKDNIDNILNIIDNSNDIDKIYYYCTKLNNYLKNNDDINYNKIIDILEKKLYNEDYPNKDILFLLKLINLCIKNYNINIVNNFEKNDADYLDPVGDNKNNILNIKISILQKCLYNISQNIYEHIFFLNNSNENNTEELIFKFMKKIGYDSKSYEDIDNLNLKRGFIKGIICNKTNTEYLLKYQPNKSIMEIIINTVIKNIKNIKENNYFLLPKYFFVNKDNSYFYIIKRYDSDLNKYFNILQKNKKIFLFENIIETIYFLLKSIIILHKNFIIHGDLKLENIVVKIDNKNDIIDRKIIDFDVSLFEKIPNNIQGLSKRFDKILNNKTPRGTTSYMSKDKIMTFNNDIYSTGVIVIILLYKAIKLILIFNNKVKNNVSIKKISLLRKNIEKDDIKIKLLLTLEKIVLKKENKHFFNNINIDHFTKLKEFVIECININNKYSAEEFLYNYNVLFQQILG